MYKRNRNKNIQDFFNESTVMLKRTSRITLPLAAAILLFSCSCLKQTGWSAVDKIIGEIHEPVFPEKEYYITDYQAIGDGLSDCTEAITQAIASCHENGGGRVIVPEGDFLTGAIHLKSNVNLHLEEGARLLFSTDPEAYLPLVVTRWEGVDCYNYSPLIYANGAENIAITGKGILDGQANSGNWWIWKGRKEYGLSPELPVHVITEGRKRLLMFEQNHTPLEERVMGDGGYLRPPFVQFYNCRKILVAGITVLNAPFWVIHPVMSENIVVRGVTINSHGPNNDGCNPESSKNVLIENCLFDTGDDCIAIKSGRNNDGRRWNIPSENIVVRNCTMKNGHGGVVIGSEVSGGCRNVFVEDCVMDSPELERALRIKTNSLRGGITENIYMRNVTVGEVKEAVIKINCMYEMKPGVSGEHPPVIRNIHVSDVTSKKSRYAIYLHGIEGLDCISDIHISNCSFEGVQEPFRMVDADHLDLDRTMINGKMYMNTRPLTGL
jgi:polygalacturonase